MIRSLKNIFLVLAAFSEISNSTFHGYSHLFFSIYSVYNLRVDFDVSH